jgi:tetratricopeptide (TPR) repeat protein
VAFFDRFRAELSRYADGVHELGDPASERAIAEAVARVGRPLPAGLVDFYRSWDGARLFTDSFVLVGVSALAVEDEATLRLGESLGLPLVIDAAGRVLEVDEVGDRVVAGTTVEKWLVAIMARERLMVDREGEWRDVFEDEGEVLRPEVRDKRLRAALKADPEAAAWRLEAAELAFEEGAIDGAAAELERAVAADPGAGVAWALLGGIHHRAGRLDEAERAFARAAEGSRDPERRAEWWAEAARASAEAGSAEARRTAAERSLAADPAATRRWLDEARERLAAGDADGAHNLAALADAVEPDGEAARLVKDARVRRALKPLS